MKNIKRKDQHGEVFTPPELVNELLDQIPEEKWIDDAATFLDNSCGNGNFLVAVYERLIAQGHSSENALSRIYGCDLMLDNIVEAIVRLYNITYSEGDWKNSEFQRECTNVEWWDHEQNLWIQYSPEHVGASSARFRYKGHEIRNLVCADGLRYHYRFDGSWPYDDEPDPSLFSY
jgi:hypothetical protein